MGRGKKIQLDRSGANFERDTQAQMYDNVEIKNWTIFSLPNKQRTTNDFMSKLQQIVKSANVRCGKPNMVRVDPSGD